MRFDLFTLVYGLGAFMQHNLHQLPLHFTEGLPVVKKLTAANVADLSPAWYCSWWACCLYVCVVLAVIWAYLNYKLRKLRLQHEEKMAEINLYRRNMAQFRREADTFLE